MAIALALCGAIWHPAGALAAENKLPAAFQEPKGIFMMFPAGWQIKEGEGGTLLTAQPKQAEGAYPERAVVTRASTTESSIEKAFQHHLTRLKESYPGCQVVKQGMFKESGIRWARFKATSDGTSIEGVSCLLLHAHKLYRIDMSTQSDDFRHANDAFSRIIRSVDFKLHL